MWLSKKGLATGRYLCSSSFQPSRSGCGCIRGCYTMQQVRVAFVSLARWTHRVFRDASCRSHHGRGISAWGVQQPVQIVMVILIPPKRGEKSAGIQFQLHENTSAQHPVARTENLRWILCMWFTYGGQGVADEERMLLPRDCRKRLDCACALSDFCLVLDVFGGIPVPLERFCC